MESLQKLNKEQQEAVCHYEGPLLILAGAGSGKTRVLTNRIAWLISEKQVDPWNILAITFTNKAAGEMKSRVEKQLGDEGRGVWTATFHSTCCRILRRFADRIGYDTHFDIYDTEDQKSVIKSVMKALKADPAVYKERTIMGLLSSAKDELIGPDEYEKNSAGNPAALTTARIYREYQSQLKKNNALDFDDLLFKTVELFRKCPDVLEYYQDRFRFIMVDEYQDTNTAQFEFVHLLSARYKNLCVVGDDDQSIYRFRGANIGNILNFEKVFPNTKVIRLEQNYRSTKNILNVANSVIHNNHGRKEKTLWTDNGEGSQVRFMQLGSGYEEADFICNDIQRKVSKGLYSYEDCAILYRTNAQSRLLEEKLMMANIPYKIIGGINFYSRKEIKDVLAYLKTISNASDDLAVRRIINIPKRGIGATSIERAEQYASVNGLSFYQALEKAREIPGIGRGETKMENFVSSIRAFRTKAQMMSVTELISNILDTTGYVNELKAEGSDEALERMENLDELISKAAAYEEDNEEASLAGFLEEVALVADIDNLEENGHQVVLMTLHSAKGLEFDNVYIAGMEENLFPSYMSIMAEDGQESIEEERRLCYVGITRARKDLTLTAARSRMIRGQVQYNRVSRFIREIPEDLLQTNANRQQRTQNGNSPEEGSAAGGTARMTRVRRERQQARSAFRENLKDLNVYKVKKTATLSYGIGDRVHHIKFGDGTVREIRDGGRDYEVSVDFDRVGVKKMFAGFAKLKKV